MRTYWNDYSLKARVAFSQNRRDEFRKTLIKTYLSHPDIPFTPTDADLGTICNLPLRAVKRYIQYWKKQGVISTTNKRYKHHEFGWCNQRTIHLDSSTIMAARVQLVTYGELL